MSRVGPSLAESEEPEMPNKFKGKWVNDGIIEPASLATISEIKQDHCNIHHILPGPRSVNIAKLLNPKSSRRYTCRQ